MNRSIWSEYRQQRLETMWAAGIVTREIGRQLNTTKNAVIGRAWRTGLPNRAPKRPPREPRIVPAWWAQLGAGGCSYDLSDSTPISWLEAGPFHFCGAAVREGSAMCAEHHALCFRPPPKKRITKVAA